MEVTDYRQDHHRNGSGGEGSVINFFRVTNEELDNEPMIGMLWPNDDKEIGEAMVFRARDIANILTIYLEGGTPENHHLNIPMWRSTDYFLPAILPVHKEEEELSYQESVAGFKKIDSTVLVF